MTSNRRTFLKSALMAVTCWDTRRRTGEGAGD